MKYPGEIILGDLKRKYNLKKKIIILSLIAVIALSSVSATRLKLTYEGTDYIVNTTRSVTENDQAYFSGMYDALKNTMSGLRLHEVYIFLANKTFDTNSGNDAGAMYMEAYYDYMDNYSHGSIGNFSDLFPEYSKLMSSPISYENSVLIAELGHARFFSDLI